MSLDFRLRTYTPAGDRGKPLGWSSLQMSLAYSDVGNLTVQVSEAVAGSLALPIVAAVERSAPGGWSETGRFLLTNQQKDLVDGSRMVTLSGVEFLPWLLQRLRIRNGGVDHNRDWQDKTVGDIVTDLISEGQSRGWGPGVTLGFTRTTDSNGQAWPLFRRSFTERMPVWQALGKLVKTGRVEFVCNGLRLDLYLPGTGVDRSSGASAVKLGAVASKQPVRETWDNIYTTLGVSLDAGVSTDVANPDAPTLLGTLEGWVDQSGVTADDVPTSLSDYLIAASTPKREVTVETDGNAGGPLPGSDYNQGDTVLVNEGAGFVPRRVVGVAVNATPDGACTVAPVTGSRFGDPVSQLSQMVTDSNSSTIDLGTGTTPTPAVPVGTRIPAIPTDVGVVASSSFDATGQPTAELTAAWSAVTTDVDGQPLTVDSYRVWWRFSEDTAPTVFADTTGTTASRDGFAPDQQMEVSVQARSAAGSWSGFSVWVPVTPDAPTDVLDAPDAPTAQSMLSLASVAWDGLLQGLPPASQFSYARLEQSVNSGDWADTGLTFHEANITSLGGYQLGDVVSFRLVAVDTQGTESAPSGSVSVTIQGVDASTLLEAGTIVGNLIQAGTLSVNLVEPAFGDQLTMTASNGVTIRVGDMVNGIATVYDHTDTEAIISAPQSNESLHLAPGRISFYQGQAEVAYWEAQVLHVDRAEFTSLTVAGWTISAGPDGDLVFRSAS